MRFNFMMLKVGNNSQSSINIKQRVLKIERINKAHKCQAMR